MITLLFHLLRDFPFLCGGHRQLALENLALRQQLAVYKPTVTRPKLRPTDRLSWVWLARVWAGWRAALVIVAPDTVLRLQRRRVREHGTKLSRRPTGGRPRVNPAIKALVLTAAVLLIAVVVAIIVDPWRGQTWGRLADLPSAARRATEPCHRPVPHRLVFPARDPERGRQVHETRPIATPGEVEEGVEVCLPHGRQ